MKKYLYNIQALIRSFYMPKLWVGIVGLVMGLGQTTYGQTVTLTSSKVTSNYLGATTKNYGTGAVNFVANEPGFVGRLFTEFDLSSIPAGATIVSAQLRLVHAQATDCASYTEAGASFQIDIKRVTSAWVEGSACNAVQAGSMTWTSAGAANWTTAGGDFTGIYATFIGGAADANGTVYTSDITALVNEWRSGTPNHGLALVENVPISGENYFQIHSDDAPIAANRPQLIVTYNFNPIPTISVGRASSCASSDGNVNVSVTGGTSPYTYLWSNGATTQDLFGLVGGTFTVTVTDNLGATATTATSTLPNLITNGMNANDLLGQYTTTAGFANNYTSSILNNSNGSTYALGFNNPYSIVIDNINKRLFVSDASNHRILVYNLATDGTLVDKTPDFVLGQPNFTSNTAATTQSGFNTPDGLAFDPVNQRLFVSDIFNNRVLVYNVATITNGMNAVNVLGQTIYTSPTAGLSQSKMSDPGGLAYDSNNQRLFVTDYANGRVLVYNVATITNGMNAANVLGQPNFTTASFVATQSGMSGPNFVAYDAANQRLFVNDQDNNRVTVYNVTTITNGMNAVNVLGQPNFTTATAATTQAGINGTQGLAYDPSTQRLFVAQSAGHRISVFNVASITNGENAVNVLGQTTFTSATAGTSQATLNEPTGLFFDNKTGRLYVADLLNNRIVLFNTSCPLSATGTVTNVLCRGASTGAINLTVSGGSTPYTYNWGGGITTQNRTGLAAGTYTVTVTDAASGTTTASFNVTQPATALSGTTSSITNIACFGASTGAVSVSAAGGTSPYQYNIDGGAYGASTSFSGLTVGSHTVIVRDANNCTSNIVFNITQPAVALSGATSSVANITCLGLSTGAVTVNAAGGTSPYQYNIDGGAYGASTSFSGLTVGSHTVIVRDANNCTSNIVFNITQPATALSGATSSITNITCFGSSTGAVTVSATGGTFPYQYNIDGGAYGASTSFSGLTAGSHTVIVRDANNCTSNIVFNITQPAAALASIATVIQPQCFAFGSITLNVTGGTVPYTYNWADIAGTSNPKDRSGLAGGSYSVTITDANGCTTTANAVLSTPSGCAPVTICNPSTNCVFSITPDPSNTSYTWTVPAGATIVSGQGTPQITVNMTGIASGAYQICVAANNICGTTAQTCQDINVTTPVANATANPICSGGTLELFGSGGGSYSWTGPNGFTSSSANPTVLNASATNNGTYNLTITDTNGCKATANVNITVSPSPSATAIVTNSTCSTAGGTINATITGGTSPYTYAWSNGTTTEDLTGISAGVYTLTVTGANACKTIISGNVTATNGPTISEIHTNVLCMGATNGSINITVTGGTSPYAYNWSNGATTANISSLAAGIYTLIVTDATGCQNQIAVAITGPTIIQTDFTKTDVKCFGQSTGAINITATGGTGTYTYSWTKNGTAIANTTANLTALGFGTYVATVRDANNCTASQTVTIIQPAAALSATTVISNVKCASGTTGQIVLTITGGTAPFTYAWTGTSGYTATTKDILGRPAGTYNVTITDANNCTFPLNNLIITQPAALALGTPTVTNVKCFGGNDGGISIVATGGTSPYTYLWSNGATTNNLTGVSAGTYTLTITDANDCNVNSAPINITQPAAVLAATAIGTNPSCSGASTGSISLAVTGGTSTYTYAWSSGSTAQSPTGLLAGTYNVTVTDANACKTNANATLSNPTAIVVSASVSNPACSGGTTGAITLTASGVVGALTYTWSDGPTTQNRTNLAAGSYSVTIKDVNNCTTVKSYILNGNSALVLSMINSNISCFGSTNGNINLTVSGGTTPYTYVWSNAVTTEDISNLGTGTYTVTTTDFNGCKNTLTSAAITAPSAIAVTFTAVNNKCFGGATGSLTANATGGTGAYRYLWSDGQITQTINLLTSGDYVVIITDENGCNQIAIQAITEPSTALEIFGEIIKTSCGGNNGKINTIANGGVAPYTYLWSNGATTKDVNALAVGTYTVTVTDNLGCIISNSFNVTASPVLTANVTATNKTCLGNDGQASANSVNGIAPFTYLWATSNGSVLANGATTQNIAGLKDGIYTVTITDGNGCAATAAGIVNLPVVACNPPIAKNDNYTTLINTPVTGTVGPISPSDPGYDSDTEDPLSSLIFLPMGAIDPTKGEITWDNSFNGSFTFTPASGFTGVVSVPYQVCDLTNLCATAILTITVYPGQKLNPDFNVTQVNVPVPGDVSTNDKDVPVGSTYGTPVPIVGNPAACTPAMASDGKYTFVCATPGVFFFNVPVCPSGVSAGCPVVLLEITVTEPDKPNNNGPIANIDIASTPLNTAVTLKTLANDFSGNPNTTLNPASVTVTTAPLHGTTSINTTTGEITYTPTTGYVGEDIYTYQVCDNAAVPKCTKSQQLITILPAAAPNSTVAADDYNATPINVAVSGNVKTNDSDPQGHTQTVTAQTSTTIAGKGTLTLATTGAYTFTPVTGFTGPVDFPYTTCDDGTPIACANATLHITVNRYCPEITNPSADNTLCLGSTGSNITVKTTINTSNSIKFVKFSSDQIAINASPTNTELATIYGGTNVLATVTPTGASNPYTATYTWNNSDFTSSGTFYIYAILTDDASGICRTAQEIKIVVNPLPAFELESTNITCNGANNGTITVKNVVGTAPFEYSINDGGTYDAPTPSTTKLYNGLPPDTYKPTVRDANGCVKKCQ